jgi:hypothetical protein
MDADICIQTESLARTYERPALRKAFAALLADTTRSLHCGISGPSMSALGLVSRVTPVQTAKRNCTRDEGGPFEFGNQVPISNHRKLLSPKATVVNVAEVSGI